MTVWAIRQLIWSREIPVVKQGKEYVIDQRDLDRCFDHKKVMDTVGIAATLIKASTTTTIILLYPWHSVHALKEPTGSWQIILVGDKALLLNSENGDTWMLLSEGSSNGVPSWVPIPVAKKK